MTRKYFESCIIKQSLIRNVNGYVSTIPDNLVEGITTDLFYADLIQGSGTELKSKFNALYSSSALAVNNFSIIKKYLTSFKFLDKTNFKECAFERKFITGLGGTPPNLDFIVESNTDLIAFESKYLEFLNKKEVKFADSYNIKRLNYLNEFWFQLIENYRGVKLHLDVAQLIKHCIGLINYTKQADNSHKNITLVYIYWTPTNADDFVAFKSHLDELVLFTNKLKKQSEIRFESITYQDFWNHYKTDEIYNDHFEKLNQRYNLKI